jgi:tRNA nucleotidyltransferase/poly(A) polymerase
MNFPQSNLFDQHIHLFRKIGELADKENIEVYLIGGFVRDIFLERDRKT